MTENRNSVEQGKTAGRKAAGDVREIVARLRAETAGDPYAAAGALTALLQALVNDGKAAGGAESLIAVLREDRRSAITVALDTTPTEALARQLGLTRVRIGQITSVPRPGTGRPTGRPKGSRTKTAPPVQSDLFAGAL